MAVTQQTFTSPINLNGNEVRFPVLQNLTSDPTDPRLQGQLYYKSDTDQIRVNIDGTAGGWKDVLRIGYDYTIEDQWTINDVWDFDVNFTIANTTKITNLNADLLDGAHASVSAVINTIMLRDASGRSQIADPIADQDVANKKYVDARVSGMAFEQPVKVAIESNISISSPSTATYDGVTLLNGDAMLLIGQTNSVENGIFVFNGTGTPLTRRSDANDPIVAAIETINNINISSPGTSTFNGIVVSVGEIIVLRAQTNPAENGSYMFNGSGSALTDYTVFAELVPGSSVFVKSGTEYGGAVFNLSSPQAKKVVIPGVDQQVWTQTNAQVVYQADGSGIELSGTTFSLELDGATLSKSANGLKINSTYPGQTSITTLGTIATGTWNATSIKANYGGTGQTTYTKGDILYYNTTSTQLEKLSIGTTNQYLKVVSGLPSWDTLALDDISSSAHAAGAVIFSNGTNLASDVTNFFWNDSTNMLGLGVNDPLSRLHIKGVTPGVRLENTSGNAGYGLISVSSSYGGLVYQANAGSAGGAGTHVWAHATTDLMALSSNGYLRLGTVDDTYGAKFQVDAPAADLATALFKLRDNTSTAFLIEEGTNDYFKISTTNTTEHIDFGNVDTDPDYRFKGAGQMFIGEFVQPESELDEKVYVAGDLFADTLQEQRIGRDGRIQMTNQVINFSRPLIISGSGTATFTVSIDCLISTSGGVGSYTTLLGSTNEDGFFKIEVAHSDTSVRLLFGALSGDTTISTNAVIPNAKRTNLTVVFDGASYIKMFVNGRLVHKITVLPLVSDMIVDVCNNASAYSLYYLYGLRIWQTAMSDYYALATSQGYLYVTNAELNWDALGIEDFGFQDISGNNRHGVLSASATSYLGATSSHYVSLPDYVKFRRQDGGYDLSTTTLITTPITDYGTGDFSVIVDLIWQTVPAGDAHIVGKTTGNNRWALMADATSYKFRQVDNSGTVYNYPFNYKPQSGDRSIGISIDRDGSFNFFVNDKLVHVSSSITQLAPSDINFGLSNTNSILISATSAGINAEVKRVMFFGAAISTANMQAYMRGEAVRFADISSITANYTPESSTTSIWEDVSGNERHSVNTSATLIKPTLQETYFLEQDYVSSQVGVTPGYYFDGTNDYVGSGLSLGGWRSFTMLFSFNSGDVNTSKVLASDYAASNDFGYIVGVVGGKLYLDIADGSTTNYFKYTAGQTLVNGANYTAIVVYDDSGYVAIYINGKKQQITAQSYGAGYTGSVWGGSNDIRFGRFGTATAYYLGYLSRIQIYNRALTDAEVSQVSRGQYLGFADYGATGAASYTSNFSVDANGFLSSQAGSVVGNIDGIDGEDNCLRITASSSVGIQSAIKTSIFTPGKRYLITFRSYMPSTNSHMDWLKVYNGYDVQIKPQKVYDQWITTSGVFEAKNAAGTTLFIQTTDNDVSYGDPGADDVCYIKDIVITPIGLVLDLNEWGMSPTKWEDQSGNGYDGTVTGATLINGRDTLYTKFIVDEDGYTGGDGQVLSRTSTGMAWINVTAAGGAGDIDGAGNGVANYMTRWVDTNTITSSTQVYDATDRIGVGFGASVPASVKLGVNGDLGVQGAIHWVSGGTKQANHSLKWDTTYAQLSNSDTQVRLEAHDWVPEGTSSDLGTASKLWDNIFFKGNQRWTGSLASAVSVLRVVDTDASGRTGANSVAGELFALIADSVSAGSGIGPSVKLQPYHDTDNNNALAAGAAWEYFPALDAWGTTGSVQIGSVVISTTQRAARIVEVDFSVAAHGGTAAIVTTTVTHNLGSQMIHVQVTKRDNSDDDTLNIVHVAWEPNAGSKTNAIDIGIKSESTIQYYKAIVIG